MTVLDDSLARILARWLDESRWYPSDPEYPGDPEIHHEAQWRLLQRYFDQELGDHFRQPAEDRPEPVTPLEAIALNRLLLESLQASRWSLIYDARKTGDSWEEIGQALGVTRQTAHKVYSADLEERARWWQGRYGERHFTERRPEYESVLGDSDDEQ
ncbi:hypothetical protein [Kitasatospora sp. NPDC098663]|uniref:hypothetical protein n=1 Tax=Kitasatospora sp. NPDC098663 TaxID=3364096 RepID=UPI00381C90F6